MRRGRPSSYTAEIGTAICERLAAGESLIRICSLPDMPAEATVRGWALDDVDGFSAKYARARDIGLEHHVDVMMEVAGDTKRDPNCRRIEVDAIKWRACKLAPKRYGDRLELAGDKDAPIQTRVVIEVVDSAKSEG